MKRTTVKLQGDRPKTHYTVVPNDLIRDRDLSSDARVVGIYLLSVEDGWETNQEQIAAVLGWPTKSKRVGNAMKDLTDRGWMRHIERKGPNGSTYQHEYVMNRARRINSTTVKSTVVDEEPTTVKSTVVTTVESTVLSKEQSEEEMTVAAEGPLLVAYEQPTPAEFSTAVPEGQDDPRNPWAELGPASSSETPAAEDRPEESWSSGLISLDDLLAQASELTQTPITFTY